MDRNEELKPLSALRIMTSSKAGYEGVASDEYLENETERVLNHPANARWLKLYAIALTISTVVLGAQSLYMRLRPTTACVSQDFQDGYKTEWGPAKGSIEQEEVTFTSAFMYNETSKTYYRELSLDEPQYVGLPRPEIDKAWEELLAGQYLVLSEDEAKELDRPVPISGLYLAEVEVMHSLHCVNSIRKALHHDYYSQHDKHALSKDLQEIHVEHCLDQLRQTIQCASDLTPVPLRPYGEGPKKNLIGTPQAHTCRNWDSFRKWYTERGITYGRVNGGGT